MATSKVTSGCAIVAVVVMGIPIVATILVPRSSPPAQVAEVRPGTQPAPKLPNAFEGQSPRELLRLSADLEKRWSSAIKHGDEGDAVAVVQAREALAAIPKTAPEFQKAKGQLERFERLDKEEDRQAGIRKRKEFAQETENTFLSNGYSVTVTVGGDDAKILRFKYALVSKAFVYQVQHQDKFSDTVRDLGFKKLVLSDGFDETYTLTY